MNLKTVNDIKTKRDSIREKITKIDKSEFKDQEYGHEGEYSYKGMIAGIVALMTDISYLIRSQKRFVKISTYKERGELLQALNLVEANLESPGNLWQQIEVLKVRLRKYSIRDKNERHEIFEEEIDNVLRRKNELIELQSELEKTYEKSNTVYNDIETVFTSSEEKKVKVDEVYEDLNSTQQKIKHDIEELSGLTDLLKDKEEIANDRLESIQGSLNEAKSNEKLISSFAEKVNDRENLLDKLKTDNEHFIKTLSEYTNERKEILKEANELIENAKKALNYKTAEGISAAFQTQYVEAKESNNWIWLVGASICLLSTIGLGMWVLHDPKTTTLAIIIGRIALLPFPIGGAIFCATQYVRQNHLKEDYAYKMVLAKSIVGFSEQIKKHGSENGTEYISYIQKVLDEIHKDPLRKRVASKVERKESEKNTSDFGQIIDLAERIVKLGKANK